ncbi:MAG TPA: AMP-binding protein [Blastocatellia bacterium]|nr:AMP-binding protein [Blastocatellia bacterium]
MNDPTPHLERFESYEQACREFRWVIPERLNIATAICRRHPDAVTRIALSEIKAGGVNTYTFGGLDFLSDKFATALRESGIDQGDSVVVVVPPSAALPVAHLGVLKAGAVVVPLSARSGEQLLVHALADSGAKTIVIDESIYEAFESPARDAVYPATRFVVRDLRPLVTNTGAKDFWSEVDRASSDFDAVKTDCSSAAFIFYVESDGEISGIVHSHRSVAAQLSAFEMFNDVHGESEAVFWTPGNWSSAAVLLGTMYPSWWYGCSVVGSTFDDPARLRRSIEECEVSNIFMPASMPDALADSEPQAGEVTNLKVRTVVAETIRAPEYLVISDPNVALNEVSGSAETGWIFGRCARWFATPNGSVGRAAPGRSIGIIDHSGNALPPRHAGHIAVHKSDPALFTEYRGDAKRKAGSFIDDWFLTGDLGFKDEHANLYVTPRVETSDAEK